MRGIVHTLGPDADNRRNHNSVTRAAVARRLAELLRYDFGGEYEARCDDAHVYFVPSDTLVGCERASGLGVAGEDDLFGGVVPHAFVATKTITHPTLDANAATPVGWTRTFAERVGDAALDGYSVFARADLERAARALLARGPVRIKRAEGIGGSGQWVVQDADEAVAIGERIDEREIASVGVVVEEQLADVQTYSVGQLRVAGIVASYWGTQRTTPNNAGSVVYGGSDIRVVRGGFDALLAMDLCEEVRMAVSQARHYDALAFDCHGPMFASRRNYDVAQGLDARGVRRSGVLEQSWRVGGASPAEVLALEALAADSALAEVRASTVEVYGASDAPPADAVVFFRGDDEHVGPITKYARTHPHADP